MEKPSSFKLGRASHCSGFVFSRGDIYKRLYFSGLIFFGVHLSQSSFFQSSSFFWVRLFSEFIFFQSSSFFRVHLFSGFVIFRVRLFQGSSFIGFIFFGVRAFQGSSFTGFVFFNLGFVKKKLTIFKHLSHLRHFERNKI